MNGDSITTKHDIGLVTASRLVAIFWAGLVPLVIPAWLLIRGEMTAQNVEQDLRISRMYVTRAEFEDRMKLLDERAQRNTETLKEIRQDLKAQNEMLQRLSTRGKN